MKHLHLENKTELQTAISLLGEVRRDYANHKAQCDSEIAKIQAAYANVLQELESNEKELVTQITKYCNEHFDEVFQGKSKTAKLITGEISRRIKPSSIVVEDLELALLKLKELNLREFIRVKEDLNKNALLDSPEIINEITGLKLQTGLETFLIKPYSINH